jgi:uncharacterized protein YjbI with pentapeptide repeats
MTDASTAQPTSTSACPHPEAVGTRWGDPISEERQAELKGYLDRWATETKHGKRGGPFQGKRLTGAEVFWLAASALAGTNDKSDIALAVQQLSGWGEPLLDGLHLEGAWLAGAHLEHAKLNGSHLEDVDLWNAHLEYARLDNAHLQQANLWGTHLEHAALNGAHLEGAELPDAYLSHATLNDAHFVGAVFNGEARPSTEIIYQNWRRPAARGAHMEHAYLADANFSGADLRGVHLQHAFLYGAKLCNARLDEAHLEECILVEANMEWSDLNETHLEGANLTLARLSGATLRRAYLDANTILNDVTLQSRDIHGVSLADVRWGNVNLAVVDWTQKDGKKGRNRLKAVTLGDEWQARQTQYSEGDRHHGRGETKDAATRLNDFETAVRANRQLAMEIRNQGLNEDADRFAYRAQILQRIVLRRQGRWGRAVSSWLLDLISGYGFKPVRSVFAYVLVILGFAATYCALGGATAKLCHGMRPLSSA